MLTTARNTLTAILLSSVAIVPAATVSLVATADAAYAKSDKSKGGGASKGNSGNNSSKASDRGAKSSKGPKSGKGKSGDRSSRGKPVKSLSELGNDIRGLFGKSKKRQKPKTVAKGKKATSSAVAKAETPEEAENLFVRGKSGKSSKFHPSELGNMNGAMNANMNAVLAHIRNGNTNGPVGHLAALAITADAADSVADLEDVQQSYADLREALNLEVDADPTSAVEEYLEREQAIAEDAELADWILAYEDPDTGGDPDLLEQINTSLEGYGAGDYDTYMSQKSSVDQNLSDLEYASGDGFAVDEPSQDDIDAAIAKDESEAAILAYWNKNPGDTGAEEGEATPQDHLLDELYARFEGYEDDIDEAIAEGEARAGEGTETEAVGETIVEDCVEAENCEPEDDLALVE